VTATQRIFRRHFDKGRQNGSWLQHHQELGTDVWNHRNWVQTFGTTAYATNKQPGVAIRTVWPPEDTERYEPLAVVAPYDQHVDSCPQIIGQIAPTDSSTWFAFSSLQITRCARTVRLWFCFKERILWAILLPYRTNIQILFVTWCQTKLTLDWLVRLG
jgi:hypothetical protein